MSWTQVPIRLVARLGSGHTPSRSVEAYWENCTIPWMTLADIGPLRDGTVKTVHETKEMISSLGVANSSAVIHPAGTVVLSRTASVGYSAILGIDMATSQDFATWTCGPRITATYLLWALRGMHADIMARTQGSTHKTIYMPDIEQLRVPLPPLGHQRVIADFLDAETARVDSLIAKKGRLIELLRARRQRVSVDGVAGKLTHDGHRRDSSLPWLETVPAHWAEVLIRLVARQGTGHTPSRDRPDWWQDCKIPWVTTGEVAQVRDDRIEFITKTREMISDLGVANSSAEVHPAGTVLLCRTASAGYSGIMGVDMATSQDFATWTCGSRLRPRYLLLCLRAMRDDLLGRLAVGSTHKTIYMPEIHTLRVPLPPLEEQDRIVELVWAQLGHIDAIADRLTRQIELWQEHRQALITAAVTGEIDVAPAA